MGEGLRGGSREGRSGGGPPTDSGRAWLRLLREGLRLLALAAPAFLFLLVWYADEHRRPLRTTPVFFAVGALALLFGRAARSRTATDTTTPGFWARGADRWGLRLAALAALGLLWLLFSRHPYQGMFTLYNLRTTGLWVAVGAAVAGLGFVLAHPPKPWVTLAVLVAGDLAIRAFGTREWPVEPAIGDMLPLVQTAIDRLLAGLDPYAIHMMQIGSQVPLTYPPGLWLAYLPARALGVDIRWTSWAADAVVAVALAWPALRAASRPGTGDEPAGTALAPAAWPAVLAAAAYLFLVDTHWNGIYAEPHVDWAAIALLACAVASGRPIAAGLALGFAVAVRPLNLPLAPLLCLGLWRIHGLRRAAQAALAAALVALAFYLPFVLWDPDAFFLGTVRWLLEFPRHHEHWFYGMMGYAGPLLESHRGAWLHPVQFAAVGIGAGLVAWLVRTPRGLLAACAAVYAVIVAFNPLIWMSFWIGAVLWIAATVSCPAPAPRIPARAPGPAEDARALRRLRGLFADARFLVAAWAVVALLAGWMVLLLARHFSTDGRTEARRALLAQVRAGDLVIDRTGWRFAFLREPYVLGPGEVPRGAWLAEDAYTAVLPWRQAIQPGPSARVLAVDRFGLFDIDRPAFAGIYRLVSEERFGRFRLTVLERTVTGRATRLSDRLPAALVSLETARGERLAASWATKPPRWSFAGQPDWLEVTHRLCLHRGVGVRAIWAHPPAAGSLVLGMPVAPAARYVLVSGGLVDEAVEWGRAPVLVDVRAGGPAVVGRLRFANEPGRFGRVVRLPEGHGDVVELAVRSPDAGRRHFCVDATVW